MGRMKLKKKPGGIVGPLPTEPRLWADWALEKRPSDEWDALHKAEIDAGTAPEPTDEDMIVGLNLYGYLAKPSNLLPPKLWKQGRVLLFTAYEAPYVQFRAEAESDIARQLAEAPGNHKVDLADVGRLALAAKAGKP